MSHIPVLLEEIIRESHIKKGDVYVDGTLGLAGHASALFLKAEKNLTIIGFDKDLKAQKIAEEKLQTIGAKPILIHASFKDLQNKLLEKNIDSVDVILLDLGLSSLQLDGDDRGFSFREDLPLHMNMNQEGLLTAEDIVNDWEEETIANIIFAYGEEKFARRIAKKICEARKKTPIKTTFQLVEVIKDAVPMFYVKGKIHPATRTFQALRIAVNNELEELKDVIPTAVNMLSSNGRLLIISFHSLEDRIVKNSFKELAEKKLGTIITKKPIVPTLQELKENPRARSAKLRVFQKV